MTTHPDDQPRSRRSVRPGSGEIPDDAAFEVDGVWPFATAAPAPQSQEAPVNDPSEIRSTPDQPLTRRQLRALREAEEARRASEQPDAETATGDEEQDAPAVTPADAITPAEESEPAAETVAPAQTAGPAESGIPELVEPAAPKPVRDIRPALLDPSSPYEERVEDVVDDEPPVAEGARSFDQLFRPAPREEQPQAAAPAATVHDFEQLTRVDPEALEPEVAPQSSWAPPVGHWSRPVENDPTTDTTVNRTIGSGGAATNALVLPEIPPGSDIRGALTNTGEIRLTGTIDLPQTLGTESIALESADLDEDGDTDASEIQPVRASRAVSSRTTGHGMTQQTARKSNRALTALIVTASVLAVSVTVLIVLAIVYNIF
jgi:hypothetical protein